MTDLELSRRQLLGTLGVTGVAATTGFAGTAAARGGRNARHVLRPSYDGLLSGATGTRDESHTLAGSWLTAPNSDKFQLYLDPNALFQNAGDVTIDDLTHVSYHTKKDVETSGTEPENVYLQLYTEQDGVDDRGSWYGYRITGEPYFAESLEAPGDEWVEWSTGDGDNQLTFFDDSYVGFGFYGGQPTLGELQDGTIDWSTRKSGATSTDIDYGDEVIKYITFQTGSGYPASFEAYLDTIEIGISTGAGRGQSENGQVARIDLEA